MLTQQKQKAMTQVKKNGIKLHIAVDILGLPHMTHITAANVSDRDGAIEMIENYVYNRCVLSRVLKFLVDGGYTGERFAKAVKRLTGAVVEVAKRNELHKFEVIPKRWVVERTFGWLDKYRRLWKNCERKLRNTSQMINLAFLRLMLNRC